jgi:hypothetical protein
MLSIRHASPTRTAGRLSQCALPYSRLLDRLGRELNAELLGVLEHSLSGPLADAPQVAQRTWGGFSVYLRFLLMGATSVRLVLMGTF